MSIAESLGLKREILSRDEELFCIACKSGYLELVYHLENERPVSIYNEALFYSMSSNNSELILYLLEKCDDITKGFVEACNLGLKWLVPYFIKLANSKTIEQCLIKLAENNNIDMFTTICDSIKEDINDRIIYITACKHSPDIIDTYFRTYDNDMMHIGLELACIYQKEETFKIIMRNIVIKKKHVIRLFQYTRDYVPIVDLIVDWIGPVWEEYDLLCAESYSLLDMYTTQILEQIRENSKYSKTGASCYSKNGRTYIHDYAMSERLKDSVLLDKIVL